MDSRLIFFIVWGLGTVVVYGVNLSREYHHFRVHRDLRARRDLVVAAGLFIAALASALSVLVVLFGELGSSMRGALVALSLGAFLGVGIVLATSSRRPDPALHDG